MQILVPASIHNLYYTNPELSFYFPTSVWCISSFAISTFKNQTLQVTTTNTGFTIHCINKNNNNSIVVTGSIINNNGVNQLHGKYSIIETAADDNRLWTKLEANFVNGKVHGKVLYMTFVHIFVCNYDDDDGKLTGYQYEYMLNLGKGIEYLPEAFDVNLIEYGSKESPYPDVCSLESLTYHYNDGSNTSVTYDKYNDFAEVLNRVVTTFVVTDKQDFSGNERKERKEKKVITTYDGKDRVIRIEVRDKETENVLEHYRYNSLCEFDSTLTGIASYNSTFQQQGYLGINLIPDDRMSSKMVFASNGEKVSVLYHRNGAVGELLTGSPPVIQKFDKHGNPEKRVV
jgi:hypothetical protein